MDICQKKFVLVFFLCSFPDYSQEYTKNCEGGKAECKHRHCAAISKHRENPIITVRN